MQKNMVYNWSTRFIFLILWSIRNVTPLCNETYPRHIPVHRNARLGVGRLFTALSFRLRRHEMGAYRHSCRFAHHSPGKTVLRGKRPRHDNGELFDKTHPLFLKNLKEAYPGLSETQVRLATYIHTGMDNKQIADFLNIRAESVKQSRWRLRSRMGLQPGESLEDALGRL